MPEPDLPLQLGGAIDAVGRRDPTGHAVTHAALLLDAVSAISEGGNDDAMLQAVVGKLRWLIGFVRVDLVRISNDGRSYCVRTLFEAQPDVRPPAQDTLPITKGPAAALFASGGSWLITSDDSHRPERSTLAVLLDGVSHGAVLFHTFEPGGFTTAEISAARTVGQHLGFALARSTLSERRTVVESELRQAVASAEAGNRAKDDFLAMVSHELRTPLQSIVGWVAMLRAGKVPPEAVAKVLTSVDRNVKLQVRLLDDLIDASRIITGKLQCLSVEFDLRSAVIDSVDAYRGAANEKGILLTVDVPQQTVVYIGDAERLRQVVGNLLSNAVKFTAKGQAVEVRMELTDNTAQITVRDHGRGMDPSFLPHVFEAFRQAEVGKARTHGGLGLGLTIAHRLVELHGGVIRAESAGIGLGTTMTVELPLSA